VVSGFVLPKFRADDAGRAGLEAVRAVRAATGLPLYAMPVLETPDLVHAGTRIASLTDVRSLLAEYPDEVLALRVGATDLSGWYGLRRPADLTIWDLHVVADALADFINLLGAADGGYVVSGPVWEYFTGGERLFKPQLRTSPFAEHAPDARPLRRRLLDTAMDGLIRETVLDRANGFTGKTVIHPSHAPAVHALSVVTHEEYMDAAAICADVAVAGGVLRSAYANKMNEAKPHRAWARRTLARAEVFGVAREDVTFVDFLDACVAGVSPATPAGAGAPR
jgi:citrate lyase beta subunit